MAEGGPGKLLPSGRTEVGSRGWRPRDARAPRRHASAGRSLWAVVSCSATLDAARECRKPFTVLLAFRAHTAAGGRGQGMDRCPVQMGKTKARSGGEIRLETLSEVVAVGVLFLQCSALSSGPLCLRKELR